MTNNNPDYDEKHKQPYFKKCERIAVCFYGQWRTGDYLVPYFVEQYKQRTGVQIDIFCSAKTTTSYPHSFHAINEKYADEFESSEKEELHAHILNSKLNPKKVNVIDGVEDEKISGIKWGKLFHGILDSIRLKSEYEVENNFVYDIVLVTRFDVMCTPIDFIDYLIKWHDTISYEGVQFNLHDPVFNNYLIAHPMLTPPGHYAPVPGVQDLFFWGSSYTMDAMSIEMARGLKSLSMYSDKSLTLDAHPMTWDGHWGLSYFARKAGIEVTITNFNLDADNGFLFPVDRITKNITTVHMPGIFTALVRASANLDLDPFDADTIHQHSWHWVADGQAMVKFYEELYESYHPNDDTTTDEQDQESS